MTVSVKLRNVIMSAVDMDTTLSNEDKLSIASFLDSGGTCSEPDRAISYDEAARLLGVCKQTICRRVRGGEIRGIGGCGKRSQKVSYVSVQRYLSGSYV